ncbi:5-carboxymethyl-2-hydroxymuconate isomerase [Leucothrix mucor]|uniref:5-carboxymethyl-2-hydroxymuconate isomerase n=1 Tax=Leucothrix mucor TaxID=45248 RepID=UPI0003B69AB4|nr:5-carboxymethyl-2-hydroxymuconate isomerase [Leucothrix mucor]
MAHFVLEYSENLGLKNDQDAIQQLFADLHTAAEDTGLFPLKGIRSRAYCCEQYRLADGNPELCFAHLEVKLGAGRSLEDRQQAAEQFFAVFTQHFDSAFASKGVALSFEMKELEPVLKFNKNNIQDYL